MVRSVCSLARQHQSGADHLSPDLLMPRYNGFQVVSPQHSPTEPTGAHPDRVDHRPGYAAAIA